MAWLRPAPTSCVPPHPVQRSVAALECDITHCLKIPRTLKARKLVAHMFLHIAVCAGDSVQQGSQSQELCEWLIPCTWEPMYMGLYVRVCGP